ncbi:MAG: hypothetical protein M3Z41_06875 [Candidatus Eremiobacteraeota bacterium]|nr:hypothetical protein [Candidatus Eremiobacteraeota bacterium]
MGDKGLNPETAAGVPKFNPLSAILFLLALGVLLTVMAHKASWHAGARLARVRLSPNPLGSAYSPGNRAGKPSPSTGHMAATNPTQRPSAPPALPSLFVAQQPDVRSSVRQPRAPLLQPRISPQSSPSPSPTPHQDTAVAPTPSSPGGQPGLPASVAYASDTDPVRILSVSFSADTVRAGDIASARVITTSNAAALTARIGAYQVNVPRVAPGTFALSMTVPHVPVLGHRVVIVVTAIRTDGATTQRSVPLDVSF